MMEMKFISIRIRGYKRIENRTPDEIERVRTKLSCGSFRRTWPRATIQGRSVAEKRHILSSILGNSILINLGPLNCNTHL